ncbi:hypothetical protein HELRODRAFT_91055 [Helobdella robusta]|uniref:Uncharacterized protein n=1 Tax=Helobdella robusta TaxID=6412 RepID=T1G7Z1_HELRO|nr:hypothetical protein HELRODRAFT_91055 [Helobdella robusta]ESN90091.1 hypothetical protein HELRODRAFT_91055 [Helobdella robusta]
MKSTEFDEIKRKLASRIIELEQQLENVLSRCIGLEKVKNRLQSEVEKLTSELESVRYW